MVAQVVTMVVASRAAAVVILAGEVHTLAAASLALAGVTTMSANSALVAVIALYEAPMAMVTCALLEVDAADRASLLWARPVIADTCAEFTATVVSPVEVAAMFSEGFRGVVAVAASQEVVVRMGGVAWAISTVAAFLSVVDASTSEVSQLVMKILALLEVAAPPTCVAAEIVGVIASLVAVLQQAIEAL